MSPPARRLRGAVPATDNTGVPTMRLRSLAVLYWMNEHPGADAQVPDEVCSAKYIKGVYKELREHNLIAKDDRSAGPPSFHVLGDAVEKVEDLAGLYRSEAIKRSVLEEVERNPDYGSTEDYLEGIKVLGDDITSVELDRAVKALDGAGLITSTVGYGSGSHLIRPELTSAGENQLRSSNIATDDVLGIEYRAGDITSNQYTFNDSPVGAFTSGNQNTVTAHQQVIPSSDLPALFAEMKSAFQQLDLTEADRGKYVGQVELIEDEFEDEKNAERATSGVRRLLRKVPEELLPNLGQLVPAAATIISSMTAG